MVGSGGLMHGGCAKIIAVCGRKRGKGEGEECGTGMMCTVHNQGN